MRVYRTVGGAVVESDRGWYELAGFSWDQLFCQDDPRDWIARQLAGTSPLELSPASIDLRAPIGSQEVWAAGVTYFRSRTARIEESPQGGDFYDRVYSADRPELFFKASPHRVVGPQQPLRLRNDSRWMVPEPELALCVNARGRIFGYTVGNDLSSRDIEGANPLYLPQAKVFDGCCGLGPCLLLSEEPLPAETEIALAIERSGEIVFQETARLEQMRRSPEELVAYLFRDNSFPPGCFLLTGTGIVPPSDFSLRSGDRVRISIAPIGTLENPVA